MLVSLSKYNHFITLAARWHGRQNPEDSVQIRFRLTSCANLSIPD